MPTHPQSTLRAARETGRRGARLRPIAAAACLLLSPVAIIAPLTGCSAAHSTQLTGDEAQIRRRIALIRDAILARSAEGIVANATPDWSFTSPDGVILRKPSFLKRTQTLFDQLIEIESLETHVDRVDVSGDTAEVEITQTMQRREKTKDGSGTVRVWLRYREKHEWVRLLQGGWKVRRVQFLGTPERRELP